MNVEEQLRREHSNLVSVSGLSQEADNSVGEERGEGRDVDEETAGPDDDTIPGCYPSIWIRADYIRTFNHLNYYFDKPRSSQANLE